MGLGMGEMETPRIGGDAAVGRAAGDGLEHCVELGCVSVCLFVVWVGDIVCFCCSSCDWCNVNACHLPQKSC